jgi:hypothetical protein
VLSEIQARTRRLFRRYIEPSRDLGSILGLDKSSLDSFARSILRLIDVERFQSLGDPAPRTVALCSREAVDIACNIDLGDVELELELEKRQP